MTIFRKDRTMRYDRWTDRARKVLQLANQEAQRLNHEYVATEHILLGLIKEGTGIAASVLKSRNLDLQKIRDEVKKIVRAGPDTVTIGRLPLTPLTKKMFEYAMEEGRRLNHNYVGTEHILLGMLREEDGVAAQVLANFGLQLEDVRREVLALVGPGTVGADKDACLCREVNAGDVSAITSDIREASQKIEDALQLLRKYVLPE